MAQWLGAYLKDPAVIALSVPLGSKLTNLSVGIPDLLEEALRPNHW